MDRKRSSEQERKLELSLETFRNNLKSTVKLIREGFLSTNTRFGLGELSETPSIDRLVQQVEASDAWLLAGEKEKGSFLRNAIIELGLVPENLNRERAIRTYVDEGIRPESEGGADVMVFKTQYSKLELHVLDYRNKDIGRRYDLVVAETQVSY
jgi:hypothetical protein